MLFAVNIPLKCIFEYLYILYIVLQIENARMLEVRSDKKVYFYMQARDVFLLAACSTFLHFDASVSTGRNHFPP